MSDDRRIALTEAGRRPVMVVLCKPKLSGCRRGSVRNPGDPNRLSKLRRSPCCASRQHTSGCHGNQPSWHVRQGQQSSDWSGFGSGQEDREDIARPAAPPSAVPLPSFAATALLLVCVAMMVTLQLAKARPHRRRSAAERGRRRSFCLARNGPQGQGKKIGGNLCGRDDSCDQHVMQLRQREKCGGREGNWVNRRWRC